jgi:hypothetical protein
MVLEHIGVLLVDLGPSLIFILLLFSKLEILAPFWAIFDAIIHLIFVFAWEKYVVLD